MTTENRFGQKDRTSRSILAIALTLGLLCNLGVDGVPGSGQGSRFATIGGSGLECSSHAYH